MTTDAVEDKTEQTGHAGQEDTQKGRPVRRRVKADLIEATPGNGGISHWVLASPLVLFLGWLWIDLFRYFSPIPWDWLDTILGVTAYIYLVLLPLGYAAHWVVTSLPRPFQHSGWDVQPLEPVRQAEMYSVHYVYMDRHRAERTWTRAWLRAAQGWVYLEIAAIFLAALLMIPIFISASEFGFGQY